MTALEYEREMLWYGAGCWIESLTEEEALSMLIESHRHLRAQTQVRWRWLSSLPLWKRWVVRWLGVPY